MSNVYEVFRESEDLVPVKGGKNRQIGDGAIIGYNALTKLRFGYNRNTPVTLGENVRIRPYAVIYSGCEFGNNVHIGHGSIVREFTKIGDDSSLGSYVVCEGYTTIGKNSIIHAQTHLTAKMIIGDFVFIGPKVTTANDRRVRWLRPDIIGDDKGPTIADGVIIGAGAALLPGVNIGEGAIVAMGAVVTKDVPSFSVVMGIPAQEVREVKLDEVATPLRIKYLSTRATRLGTDLQTFFPPKKRTRSKSRSKS